MKKTILFASVIILLAAISERNSFAQDSRQKTDSRNEKNDKVIQLFNGQNLDGWYTFIKDRGRNNDPKNVFTVNDGIIRISGEEWGCITTNEEFENYKLVTEFKWGEIAFEPRLDKARDSGILLHSQGEDGGQGGIWIHSIECQVIEGGTGDFIVVGDGSDDFRITSTVASEKQGNSFVFQPDGQPETINSGRINWFARDPQWKDVFGFRGKNDVEKAVGQWNRLECIVDNGTISIFLNGVLVNEATDVNPKNGRIQIQSESAEIFFRKVELIPLPKK